MRTVAKAYEALLLAAQPGIEGHSEHNLSSCR